MPYPRPNREETILLEMLLKEARKAADNAYCPYSNFKVGAAVLADGKVYLGCNIENASYGLTLCAERVAIMKAVSEGKREIQMLALSVPSLPLDAPDTHKSSCGACRQFMAEFMAPDAFILQDGLGVTTMEELMPKAFRLTSD